MAEVFKFIPEIGMVTKDSYLHGVNTNDNLCNAGEIEYVGSDYFILRDKILDKPLLVHVDDYWIVGETTFIK